MAENNEIKKYSTTVKITKGDGEAIDSYIARGYYPSRSRFIVEAIRVA